MVLLLERWVTQHIHALSGEATMDTWIQLTDQHGGKTAGAVLETDGTAFDPSTQQLMLVYCRGANFDSVICEADDVLKPSDRALGIINLPEFLRKN